MLYLASVADCLDYSCLQPLSCVYSLLVSHVWWCLVTFNLSYCLHLLLRVCFLDFDTLSLVYTCIQAPAPFYRFSDQTKIEHFVLCIIFRESQAQLITWPRPSWWWSLIKTASCCARTFNGRHREFNKNLTQANLGQQTSQRFTF